MKYKELYDCGKAVLEAAGMEEAALDSRLLLEHVCHTDRNTLLVHGDIEVTEAECKDFLGKIEKRKKHIPLQHITGEQAFMGLKFAVNEHVLIPRQDTEVLVEEVMRYLHDGMAILDMCTGSGCILLSLLHYSNDCSGTGVDISEKALETAENNAEILGEEGCKFIRSNLFEKVEGRYDIIVSNPPYIPTGVIETLMQEVKDNEPLCALDGREDGLFFYRKIILNAADFLQKGGYLFFEIGYDQADAVLKAMENAGYKDAAVIKDFAGLDRVVYGRY